MGGGVGLIDYDGDGWLDIYFVNGCRLPCRPRVDPPAAQQALPQPGRRHLRGRDRPGRRRRARLRHGLRGGRLRQRRPRRPVRHRAWTQTILYRNRGDGTFEDVTVRAGVSSDRWTTAAGFADLDGDGDLDLVVVTYVEADPDDASACRDYAGRRDSLPARAASRPGRPTSSATTGTARSPTSAGRPGSTVTEGRGLGLAIADLDERRQARPVRRQRRDAQLPVPQPGRAEVRGGRRPRRASPTTASGRRHGEHGGRRRRPRRRRPHRPVPHELRATSRARFCRNLGGGLFHDVTLGAGLDAPSRPMTGFGDAALDIDNDGRLDLFVANGHVDDRPWANSPMAQTAAAVPGRGPRADFGHDRRRVAVFLLDRHVVGRGVAAGDLDNDGRVDLVVVHRDAPAALLCNRTGVGTGWGSGCAGRDPADCRSGPASPAGPAERTSCAGSRAGRAISRPTTPGSGSDSGPAARS